MERRRCVYFSVNSWEILEREINHWLESNSCNLVSIVPLYKSPDINTIIWYEAYAIVEDL